MTYATVQQNEPRLIRTSIVLHVAGQPQTIFALATAAEALADRLACRDEEHSFDVVMSPRGDYAIAVCTRDNDDGPAEFLGFV